MFVCLIAAALAQPADRVMWVVGERVVTGSDVSFEAFFRAHDASPVPVFELAAPPDGESLRDLAIVRQVAGDTAIFRPDGAEVRARADRFLASFPRPGDGLAELAAWGFDEEAFLGFVYSRLVAERCILRNVPLALGASAEEQEAWLRRYATWLEEQRVRVPTRAVAAPE